LLYKRVLPCKREEESGYEKTAKTLIYSSFVLLLNLLAIKFIFKGMSINFESFDANFKNVSFLMKYIMLTLVSSSIFAVGYHYINKKVFLRLHNKHRKSKGLSIETVFPTVWDEIFENPVIDITNTVISVHKDGEMISQGFLSSHSPPTLKDKEITLIYSSWVKQKLDDDKKLPEDKRLLDQVDVEYYDFSTGTLIKKYNSDKICAIMEPVSE